MMNNDHTLKYISKDKLYQMENEIKKLREAVEILLDIVKTDRPNSKMENFEKLIRNKEND